MAPLASLYQVIPTFACPHKPSTPNKSVLIWNPQPVACCEYSFVNTLGVCTCRVPHTTPMMLMEAPEGLAREGVCEEVGMEEGEMV